MHATCQVARVLARAPLSESNAGPGPELG